eukprot:16412_1
MTVIPKCVVSVCAKDIKFPYSIGDISSYLEGKKCNSYRELYLSSEQYSNISTISHVLQEEINVMQNEKNMKGISWFIIVDRRKMVQNYVDAVYISTSNNLKELNENYFISLQFNVDGTTENKITKCHLFYGETESERFRFYPEHLRYIVPRFFVKGEILSYNYYDQIQALYNGKYKHGFAVQLNDQIFNKIYKQVTHCEHISVNNDRNAIKQKQEEDFKIEYEYKDIQFYELNKMMKICDISKILNIEECPYIDYIIESLHLFREMNRNDVGCNKFNLMYLTQCYDHIICTHSFCLNNDQRLKIKEYICKRVGKCENGKSC